MATIGWCQPLTAWSKLRSHDPIWWVPLYLPSYLPSVWNMNNFNDASDVSNPINMVCIRLTGWWIQIFFMFSPIWRRFSFWQIFFNGVETTDRYEMDIWMVFQSTSSEQNRHWQIIFLRNRALVLFLAKEDIKPILPYSKNPDPSLE